MLAAALLIALSFFVLYYVVKNAVRNGINESNLFEHPPEFDPDEHLKEVLSGGLWPPEPKEFSEDIINKKV